MEILIWDKRSDINGASADYVLQNNREFLSSDVFLVTNGEVVTRIECVNTWKSILNMPNATTDEVIVAFRDYVTAQNQAAQNTISENEQLKKEVADLWFEILSAQGGTK